jgi:hypothetical protein
MDPQRRRPIVRVVRDGRMVRPRRSLGEWIQAWKLVMRDPDKPIPDAAIPPEGQPIPAELDLQCPECKYKLGGLTEWICPSCGEPFNPIRTYTLRMMQEPEYFLRYRLDPADIRKTLLALILVAAGFLLVLVATAITIHRGQGTQPLPISKAWYAMSLFMFLSVPLTLLLHLGMEVALPRILFFFSVPWFLMCLVLLILACA